MAETQLGPLESFPSIPSMNIIKEVVYMYTFIRLTTEKHMQQNTNKVQEERIKA